ncbi:MAG: molybdopterin-binding protein [Paenibacillus sp.]|jgi:molybdenum cofactor synthesis domain-containing protein|nr:molybdopterin-binding protein [Paenibacillus sp.]
MNSHGDSLTTKLVEVKVEDAIGLLLAHDLTQIIPGQFKGRKFKKGHVIREDDIPELLRIGKAHIYVMELGSNDLHEDEAALRMAQAVAGDHVELTEPSEGKVIIRSSIEGVARIEKAFIDHMNAVDQIAMATVTNFSPVRLGQSLAGTRVIPLVVAKEKIEAVELAAARWKQEHNGQAPISVLPFTILRVGLITTGSEVYTGLVEDKFGPVVREKIEALGSRIVEQRLCPDDSDAIVREIRHFQQQEVDLILITGGMSVDPDDRTPGAINQAGARIVSHGTPMLPGSMLMMAYLGDLPIMGLPGCVMYDRFTSFDVLLPRICAGLPIERQHITELGYGGLHADKG